MVGPTTPLVVAYCRPPTPIAVVYFTESAKNASSAVIRFRRSDFIEARYAFSFVFANFGIAIAVKIPMITTTIRSSISVKPLRFIPFPLSVRCGFPAPLSATVMPYRFEGAQATRGQRLTRAEHAVHAPEAPTGVLQPAINIATRYKHGWVTRSPNRRFARLLESTGGGEASRLLLSYPLEAGGARRLL